MPDSFPPPGWGPPPFDEWDLEALLSGELTDIPMALRQVAEALTALRAAPTSAELRGEAMIMAEFRALAEFPELGLSEAARAGGLAHTRELPVLPSALAPRRAARHRAPGRRIPRVLSWPAVALTGAAAAAVIAAAVAFAGDLPGPMHSVLHSSTSTTARSRPAGHDSGSPNLAVRSAAAEPTGQPAPSPGASPPQSQGSRLCAAYFGGSGQQGQARWVAEFSLFWQLSKLARGPQQVYGYCERALGKMFPHEIPWSFPYQPGWHPGAPGSPGQDNPPGNSGHGNPPGKPGQGNPGPGQSPGTAPGSHL